MILVYYHDIRWQQRLHIWAIHVEAFLGDESGPAGEGTEDPKKSRNHRLVGKIDRKVLYFMAKSIVSCRFSLKPIYFFVSFGDFVWPFVSSDQEALWCVTPINQPIKSDDEAFWTLLIVLLPSSRWKTNT
jgi:hypothetical protein